MKKAHKRVDSYSHHGWHWTPVELTGVCKKVTGGINDIELHYYQAQYRFLGIPIYKYWIYRDNVRFYEPEVETIYECKCND